MKMQLSKLLYAIGILLLMSCKGTAKDNIQTITSTQQVKPNQDQIDFFNKKYFTTYNLAIDESNLSDHPYFSYLDCKNEGYFSVHFVPKEKDLQLFWSHDYYKKEDFNTYDFEKDNRKIEALIKNNLNAYNVFSYFIKKEYLDSKDGCTLESIWLTKNAIAEIFLYNLKTNEWELVKKKSSKTLPPYADNNFFISHFPNLFVKQNKAVNEEKTFPSDLKGSWAVSCDNGLTTFNINKDEGLISLYGNSIYIKVQVEKRFENEYILKFKQIADQKDWVDTSLRITESEISKDKIIGKFFIKKDGKVELHWEGLYNIKKQKIDYTGKDFSLIRESDGENPILLQKC
ncbi:hypothetical protein [Chryseobacterium indoltheticum]|uniref:hypothetical protein n=1 Tax=Chryseobacterium indoltheticum TaxID=254 RepID=UPI0028EDB7DD|nr:hypothetical protein [Chryseobacterium indoltheticum]